MHQIQSRFPLEGYLETRIGGRPENQDACGFSDTPLGALALVCDGMGGMNGGSTASHMAVKTIIDYLLSSSESEVPEDTIRNAVNEANTRILEAGINNPDLQGMGTTLTLVLVNKRAAYITHVGDSRVYQLRAGKKVYRTFDDSVVFQLVKTGAITEEEARVADNSNIITKALGISTELEIEVATVPYDKGDRFVLCTDGFWGPLPEPDFIRLFGTKDKDLALCLEHAFNRVEGVAKEWRPTHYDNLTAAVFDLECYSIIRSRMEKRLRILSGVLSLLLCISIGLCFYSYRSGNTIDRAIKYQERAIKTGAAADSLANMMDGKQTSSFKQLDKALSKANNDAKRDRRRADRAVSAAKEIIDKVNKLNVIVTSIKESPENDSEGANQ